MKSFTLSEGGSVLPSQFAYGFPRILVQEARKVVHVEHGREAR
jgi:hypothetical protein